MAHRCYQLITWAISSTVVWLKTSRQLNACPTGVFPTPSTALDFSMKQSLASTNIFPIKEDIVQFIFQGEVWELSSHGYIYGGGSRLTKTASRFHVLACFVWRTPPHHFIDGPIFWRRWWTVATTFLPSHLYSSSDGLSWQKPSLKNKKAASSSSIM